MKQKSTFSTKFLLRACKGTKMSGIYCRITINGSRAEFYTQKKISKDCWKNGQVKSSTEDQSIRQIFQALKQLIGTQSKPKEMIGFKSKKASK